MNSKAVEATFESDEKRRGYVTPETFHKYVNTVIGLKLGKNAMYEQLARGEILAVKTGLKSYQIPFSELEGDNGASGGYEARKLAEAQGIAPAHAHLLGRTKNS